MTNHPPAHHILRAEHYARRAEGNRGEIPHLALRQLVVSARHYDRAGDTVRSLEQYDAAVWLRESMEQDADAAETEHRRRERVSLGVTLPGYDVPTIDDADLQRRAELVEMHRPSAPVDLGDGTGDGFGCPFGEVA